MKKLKQLLVVVPLALAVTACGSGGSNAPGSNSPGSQPGPASSQPSGMAEGPLGKYDPPIEITTVKASGPNTKYLPGESAEDNVWTKGYLKELGIKVKYDWVATPGDEYVQKFNVMLASSEIPDFLTADLVQLKQMYEAGMLEDLTAIYDEYASELTKTTINDYGPIPLKAATFDGKLMGIPFVNAPIDGAQVLWVRTDWLNKLNLPEPKTMADVFAIAEAFATGDPDGNKVDDTVGLALQKDFYGDNYAVLFGYFNGFHAYPKTWVKDNSGALVYGSIQPEMRNALAELQRMFKEGLLDKEFGVKNGAAVVETIVSGKAGLSYGAMWNPLSPFLDLKKQDPGSEWRAYPIPSVDGQPARPVIGSGVTTFHVARKGVAHPEAMVKMTNLFLEKGFGESAEQDVYFKNNGVEVFSQAHFVTWPPKNLNIHLNIKEALESGDESKLNPEEVGNLAYIRKFEETGDPESWAYNNVFGPEGSYKALNYYQENKLPISNEFYGLPTKSMTEKLASLDKIEIEMITKIIMGAPLEEFDKFVADWKRLGGDDITAEVNEWHKAQ